jgi:hypothetical protein
MTSRIFSTSMRRTMTVVAVEAEGERVAVVLLRAPLRLRGEEAHLLAQAVPDAAVVAVEPPGQGLAVEQLLLDRALDQHRLVRRRRHQAAPLGELLADAGGVDHDRRADGGGRRRPMDRPLRGEQQAAEDEEVERGMPERAHAGLRAAAAQLAARHRGRRRRQEPDRRVDEVRGAERERRGPAVRLELALPGRRACGRTRRAADWKRARRSAGGTMDRQRSTRSTICRITWSTSSSNAARGACDGPARSCARKRR